MLLGDIIKKTDFQILSGSEEKEIYGCYIGDLLSLAMSKVCKDNAWITIQSNINIVAVASLAEAGCVIICEGFEPDDGVIERAKTENVTIVKSDMSAYDIAKIFASLGI